MDSSGKAAKANNECAEAAMDAGDNCQSAAYHHDAISDFEEHRGENKNNGDVHNMLKEDLIRELESGWSPGHLSNIYQTKKISAIEANKLHSAGFVVLDDLSSDEDRQRFRKAIREQGNCFIRGDKLAITAANSKDHLCSQYPVLYDKFFPYLCVNDDLCASSFQEFESVLSGTDSSSESDSEATDTCDGFCGVESKVDLDSSGVEDHETGKWQSRLRSRLKRPENAARQAPAGKRRRAPAACSSSEQQKQSTAGTIPAEGSAATEETTQKATITGILLCIYAYLVSIPCVPHEARNKTGKFVNIFQRFASDQKRATEAGDGSRSQIKAQQFPVPTRHKEETDQSFYQRFAGFAVLLRYFEQSFDLFAIAIESSYDICRHWDKQRSSSLRSQAPSEAQEMHADHDPRKGPSGISVVSNVSWWPYWFAVLQNSTFNIKRFHSIANNKEEMEKFKQAFEKTRSLKDPSKLLSSVIEGETFDDKWKHAWQCHCELLIREDMAREGETYKEMQLRHVELEPFMWLAFDTREVHGGGQYPGRAPHRLRQRIDGSKRWFFRYGKVHFRYQL